jgi:hypothetical protein
MCCTARACNDDAQAALPCRLGVLEEPVGRAMRADDARFMRNLKLFQNVDGCREHFVIALAPHHNAH